MDYNNSELYKDAKSRAEMDKIVDSLIPNENVNDLFDGPGIGQEVYAYEAGKGTVIFTKRNEYLQRMHPRVHLL